MAAAKKVVGSKKPTQEQEGIFGYCMKTKSNNLMQDVVIKNSNNRFIASGVDADGNKITKIMSATQASEAVENGWAEMAEEAPAKKKVVAAPAKKK